MPDVSFDGEAAVMEAPLHYRIRPRALRLVAPERRVVHRRFPPGRWSEHG
jgi:diacylglycerol kinase family enzyme